MICLTEVQRALQALAGDPALYVDMAEGLCRKTARIVRAGAEGLLLLSEAAGVHMLMSRDGAAAARLLAGVEIQALVVHEAHALEPARRLLGLRGALRYHHARYETQSPPPELPVRGLEIRRLDMREVRFVQTHYHSLDGADYVRERIAAGTMYGAFMQGAQAGFIGEHDEGAMGMLVVLPAYRMRGIAYALERDAIRRALQEGKRPYCQVAEGNEASLRLQTKLGFSLSDASVVWMAEKAGI